MYIGAPPVKRQCLILLYGCTARGFSIKPFSGLTLTSYRYSSSFPKRVIFTESSTLFWSQEARMCARISRGFMVVRGERGRMLDITRCKLYLLLLHHAGKSWYKCLKYSATVRILSLFSSHALVASWCLGSSRGLGHQVLQENWREGDQQVEEVVNHLAFGWETLTLVRGLIGTLREEGWPGGLLLLFPSRNRNARWCLRDCRRCMAA